MNELCDICNENCGYIDCDNCVNLICGKKTNEMKNNNDEYKLCNECETIFNYQYLDSCKKSLQP